MERASKKSESEARRGSENLRYLLKVFGRISQILNIRKRVVEENTIENITLNVSKGPNLVPTIEVTTRVGDSTLILFPRIPDLSGQHANRNLFPSECAGTNLHGSSMMEIFGQFLPFKADILMHLSPPTITKTMGHN